MGDSSGNSKKRSAEGSEVPQALQNPPAVPTPLEVWRTKLLQRSYASTGLATLANYIQAGNVSHHALLVATTKMDLRDLGTNYIQVPEEVDVVRGDGHKITRLSCGGKHLEERPLQKLLAVFAHFSVGHRAITFDGTVKDKPYLGFYTPLFNEVEWVGMRKNMVKVQEEFVGTQLIMSNTVVNSALTKQSVLDVLALGVSASQVPTLVKALNDILLVTEDFDPSLVTNLKDVVAMVEDETLPKKARAFYTALLGAMMAKSTMDEKVAAFVGHPSLRLGMALSFCKPFVRGLFQGNKNSVVQKRNLSTLKPNERVILSNVGWDGKFYEEEASLTLTVFTESADLKVKVGRNSFRPCVDYQTISAEHLRTLISAITTSRAQVAVVPKKEEEPPAAGQGEGEWIGDF